MGLDEVRAWVAQIPDVDEGRSVEEHVHRPHPADETSTSREQMFFSHQDNSEVNTFQLSIGSIQLTVEGSQEEKSQSVLPRPKKVEAPESERPASRLSRHYLR